MSLLLAAVMKSSIVLLAGLGLSAMLRRHSAATRHWLLAAVVGCAALVPLAEPIVPSWGVPWVNRVGAARTLEPTETISVDSARPAEAPAQPAQASTVRWFDSAVWIRVWLLGLGASVLWLAIGFLRLRRITAGSIPITGGMWAELADEISREYKIRRPVRLLYSRHTSLLATWGVLRPRVVLPMAARDWPLQRARIVMAHELAHVRRADWAVQLVAEFLRAAYWFNPLAWTVSNRLRQESERACDDAVLSLGVDGTNYAEHLLELARIFSTRRSAWVTQLPAPGILRRSSLEQRIMAMLNTRTNRGPIGRLTALTMAAATVALTFALAGFGAAAQGGFASLSGSVLDPLNKPVPGVVLTLASAQRQASDAVKTDELGRFEFVGLPGGDYQLTTRIPGFITASGPITMSGQDARQNVSLQIGEIEETVLVTSSDTAPDVPPPSTPAVRLGYDPANDRCSQLAFGGCIKPPLALRHVRPFYPTSIDAEGVVKLSGTIGADGLVTDVRAQSPVQPDLAAAAIQAVSQWEFVPTRLDTFPVSTRLQVTMKFSKAAATR